MGFSDQGDEGPEDLTLGLLVARSAQVVCMLMEGMRDSEDPVSRTALGAFALTTAAELCLMVPESNSGRVLSAVKEVMPRA